jgi:serine/threonine protein kinase
MSGEHFAKFVGTTINGKSDVIRQLGAGGTGVVFQAHHAFMDKPVAIKMLSAELTNDEIAFKRFQSEARAAALNHTNIIRVFDLDMSSNGYPFIVMDYPEGRSLDKILERQKTLKWQRRASVHQGLRSPGSRAQPQDCAPRYQAEQHNDGARRRWR